MASVNVNGENSNSTELLTTTLKDMLKINGNNSSEDANGTEQTVILCPAVGDDSLDLQQKESLDEASLNDPAVTSGQIIDLSKAADGECIPITDKEVYIITNPSSNIESTASGSNKVRIRPITKFEWEHKYYPGSIVSVSNTHIAYSIKSRSYAVRIINRANTSDRLLLRGFTTPICDVAFAHSSSSLISAIDEAGNFVIWQLSLNGDSTTSLKRLHVEATEDIGHSTSHRLVWLTHMHCDIDNNIVEMISSEGDSADSIVPQKKLLGITHGNIAEVWDINAAFEAAENDPSATDSKETLKNAFLTITGHDDIISDCELSPEGSVLAAASLDGFVKFWQINLENHQHPNCLHRWKPHGDRPVSLVTFCDDRKQPNLVLYWRFMLTGCDHNTELKIWCTVTWSCLQTISFQPPAGIAQPLPALKCALHEASDYLLLSDVNRKVIYVMHCFTDLTEEKASLTSISQYLLTTPLLSFAILEARKRKFRNPSVLDEDCEMDNDQEVKETDAENEDDTDEDNLKSQSDQASKTRGVLIKLISVHTKSLENLDIRFIPSALDDPMSSLSISTYNTMSDDQINTISVDDSLSIISPSVEEQSSDEIHAHMDMEENEDADASNNKTGITALEGDQSTIHASNDNIEDNQMSPDVQVPTSPVPVFDDEERRSQRQITSPDSLKAISNIMDLVVDVEGQPPVAQSSPSTMKQNSLHEISSAREEGEGEASAASPSKFDAHPVLLTPDAFTSSLRKSDHGVTGSAESSFTHITPFSVEHISLYASEKDKSLQESVVIKSPILPTITQPPGLPTSTSSDVLKTDVDLRPSVSPLIPPVSPSQPASYHSVLHSLGQNEAGPFGDAQSMGFMTKDKSPDLISSASTLESVGGATTDGRVLIGGPMLGAVGGSGDALFTSSQSTALAPTEKEDDRGSNVSRRSEPIIASSSAPWPKAPDVTMSRPVPRSRTSPSNSREEFLRSSIMPKSQLHSRANSDMQADVSTGEHARQIQLHNGGDLLEAIVNLQKQQEELLRAHQKELSKKHTQVLKNVEVSLKKFDQQQSEKLDRALKGMSEMQRKFQAESRGNGAASADAISGKIDRAIRSEMKCNVIPTLSRSLDPLKDQLHNTLAQKLTATDSLLRESIPKLVKSKETVELIGSSAGRAIQSHIYSAYKETFISTVIPAFEKSCNVMFQQLAGTFQRGMEEAVLKLEKQIQFHLKGDLDRMQATEKEARDAISDIRDVTRQANESLTSAIEREVPKLVSAEMKSAQERMLGEIAKTMQQQQKSALKEQKDVLEESLRSALADISSVPTQDKTKAVEKGRQLDASHRATPSARPTFEQVQQIILNLLHQGNLNAAFQRALTASDLNLVMYVCEMVDPAIVFGSTPCPLHQPILLSLIQQLSCDLGHNTPTKLKYLQEAVMNLDRSHQVTQEHMHTVLESLVKNLVAHTNVLSALPTDASNTGVIKQMKMLAMAAQSLVQ